VVEEGNREADIARTMNSEVVTAKAGNKAGAVDKAGNSGRPERGVPLSQDLPARHAPARTAYYLVAAFDGGPLGIAATGTIM
jgi:hypothetical protein